MTRDARRGAEVAVAGDAPRDVADVGALLRLQLSERPQRAGHAGKVVHGQSVTILHLRFERGVCWGTHAQVLVEAARHNAGA